MAFTNSEVVSRIKNQLRFLTKDDQINDRFILYTAKNIATTYISQRLKDMSLYREYNLFYPIDCVEMEKVSQKYCNIFEFKSCEKLIKSKKKLPELIYSRLGSSLKEVTSVDNKYLFKQSTIAQYRRDLKRKGYEKGKHFYIIDGYLYIPDVKLKKVNLLILTLDLYDANEISTCSENCMSAWDYNFVCPDKILEQVIRDTVQQLTITKQVKDDENPNLSNLS